MFIKFPLIVFTALIIYFIYFSDGPDLVRGPTKDLAGWNQSVTLVCGSSVHSNPEAEISWRDNNNGVVDVTQERFSLDSSNLMLTIARFNGSDAGHWTCVVTGGKGTITHSVHVEVLGEPMREGGEVK